MKKIVLFLIAVSTFSIVHAQSNANAYEFSRKVATRGYAEREVTPDILYLSISLREYFEDGNTKKKVRIEALEKQLFDAAMAVGVKKEDFTIQNIYSYNYDTKKKRNNELLQAKQFRIKVTNLNGLNAMLDKVDPKGMQNTSISGYDHSQKRQIEKELKVAAVQDARANAEIIASATGDKIGKVLTINDNSSFGWNDIQPTPRMYAASSKVELQSADSAGGAADLEINVKPIKLTCNIDGVFELQ